MLAILRSNAAPLSSSLEIDPPLLRSTSGGCGFRIVRLPGVFSALAYIYVPPASDVEPTNHDLNFLKLSITHTVMAPIATGNLND